MRREGAKKRARKNRRIGGNRKEQEFWGRDGEEEREQ